MKRILSLILCTALFCGIFTCVASLTVFGEGDSVETQVWKPVEITLTSSKEYKNPYTDVDIDAVFTHTDGTVITTPGFWKEGATFAVRFTPTKTGEWTYVITSTDTENTSLHNVKGTVKATENTGDSAFDKHGFVQISEDNRHFEYADGTSFFWLGDTNWQAPNYVATTKCNYPGCNCDNQFKHEVDNRVAKGFNVYQTYFDSATSDGGGQRGVLPSIWSKTFTLPNAEVFNDKIDYMFEYLYQNGMVVALGMGVHSSTANAINETDLLRFTRYVVARYSCYSIFWITGQEVNGTGDSKTPGKRVIDVYKSVGNTVSQLDGYDHPNGTHIYTSNYSDSSIKEYDAEEWHEFWALQNGHGNNGYFCSKTKYLEYYYYSNKPMIETEANYEDIDCGGFTGYDANRKSAWAGVLCGSAGFTYGSNGIWANCYSTEKSTGWLGSYSYGPWYMTLDNPGSYEVKYLKEFFESIPEWTNLVPRFGNTLYADFAENADRFVMSNDERSTYVCYFRDTTVDTGYLKNVDTEKTYNAYWYNVLTGAFIKAEENVTVNADGTYKVPVRPNTHDWAFILTDGALADGVRFENAYSDVVSDTNEIEGNIITPASVTALGGAEYYNGKLIDLKEYLSDLSGDKAWSPYSSRMSQTIIYDLGTAYNLTDIAIVPQVGTVLPNYRIEVSNDGKTWTIMADATIRDKKTDADGKYVSEKLTGAYRFVKVLFVNPKTIDEADAKGLNYLTENKTYTGGKNQYWSKTAIVEISVFGTGKAEVSVPSTSTPTATAPVDNGGSDVVTSNNGGKLNVALLCGVSAGALVVGGGAGVAVAIVLKKKKKEEV